MSSPIRRTLTRSLLALSILAAATPLAAFRGQLLYDVDCLIAATKGCYAQYGLTVATLRCIAAASGSCKAS